MKDMRAALTETLLAIAMRDPDPIERAAKLEILRKDGWINTGRKAA